MQKNQNNLEQGVKPVTIDTSEMQGLNPRDPNTQILIDIQNMKDIDNSPSNIKELSKLVADQIASFMNEEINRLNNDEAGDNSQRRNKKALHDNIFKVNLTDLNKKKQKP